MELKSLLIQILFPASIMLIAWGVELLIARGLRAQEKKIYGCVTTKSYSILEDELMMIAIAFMMVLSFFGGYMAMAITTIVTAIAIELISMVNSKKNATA